MERLLANVVASERSNLRFGQVLGSLPVELQEAIWEEWLPRTGPLVHFFDVFYIRGSTEIFVMPPVFRGVLNSYHLETSKLEAAAAAATAAEGPVEQSGDEKKKKKPAVDEEKKAALDDALALGIRGYSTAFDVVRRMRVAHGPLPTGRAWDGTWDGSRADLFFLSFTDDRPVDDGISVRHSLTSLPSFRLADLDTAAATARFDGVTRAALQLDPAWTADFAEVLRSSPPSPLLPPGSSGGGGGDTGKKLHAALLAEGGDGPHTRHRRTVARLAGLAALFRDLAVLYVAECGREEDFAALRGAPRAMLCTERHVFYAYDADRIPVADAAKHPYRAFVAGLQMAVRAAGMTGVTVRGLRCLRRTGR